MRQRSKKDDVSRLTTPKVGVIFEEIRVLLSSSKTKALIQKSLGVC